MRQKRVWRYYCDHCKKGGCGKAAMVRHEEHCIKNPTRSCRMCNHGDGGTHTLPDLLAALASGGISALREEAGGCPACMLAAVWRDNLDRADDPHDWNYREEHQRFWSDANSARREWEGHY